MFSLHCQLLPSERTSQLEINKIKSNLSISPLFPVQITISKQKDQNQIVLKFSPLPCSDHNFSQEPSSYSDGAHKTAQIQVLIYILEIDFVSIDSILFEV